MLANAMADCALPLYGQVVDEHNSRVACGIICMQSWCRVRGESLLPSM